MGDTTETNLSDRPKAPLWQRALPWLITIACFAHLYGRVHAQAAREGQTAVEFLLAVFANVSWGRWLALMIPRGAGSTVPPGLRWPRGTTPRSFLLSS